MGLTAIAALAVLVACGTKDDHSEQGPPDAAPAGCAWAKGTITYQQVILASRMVAAQGNFVGGSLDDCPALKPADLAQLDPACAPAPDLATCRATVACDTQPRPGTTRKWSGEYILRSMSLVGTLTLNQRKPNAAATCKYDVIGRFANVAP